MNQPPETRQSYTSGTPGTTPLGLEQRGLDPVTITTGRIVCKNRTRFPGLFKDKISM